MIPPNKADEPRLDYQSAYLHCPICDGDLETVDRTYAFNQTCNHCQLYKEFYTDAGKDPGSFNVVVGHRTFTFDGHEPDELAEWAYAAVARARQEMALSAFKKN